MENQALTRQQQKALHLWFRQLADVLREEGNDIRQMLSYPILPTETSVKEVIFKPILFAAFGKKSTKELSKQKEIDDCYDIICKTFGEMGIKVPPFPSEEELNFQETYAHKFKKTS